MQSNLQRHLQLICYDRCQECSHVLDLFALHFASLSRAPPWRRYCVPDKRTVLGRSNMESGVLSRGTIATA